MTENNAITAVEFMQNPYKVIKANSGGIRFTVVRSIWRHIFCLHLLKKACPHEQAYTITLSENSALLDIQVNERKTFRIPNFYNQNTHELWLTWYNNEICLGKFNEPALLEYSEGKTDGDKDLIGFVKFETCNEDGRLIEWIIESPPAIYAPMRGPKPVTGGELKWVRMNKRSKLPIDALIGGFEDEPLYIARATHRGSLCPGKYVRSKRQAFISWGHEVISKNEFEILCGYDAVWVKCNDNQLPENAFIGGFSEVYHEPLFIGRAWVRSNLVVGKIHMLYNTCYLPFHEKEVERSEYEALVMANKPRRGESSNCSCYMNMVMQPCVC